MNKEALTKPALDALLEAPSLAVLAVDKQGCVILWSPSASRMFGWTESEVLGHFLPIVPEDERQVVYDRIQSELKGENAIAREVRRLRKDGSLVDISFWTAPLRDNRGEVIGVLGLCADISTRKRAEAALQENEAELRRVLTAVSDYIYSGEFDSDGRFFYHYYSPAVERILGRPPLFFLAGAEQWLSTIHLEDRPRLAQAFARLQTGQSSSEEEEYRILLPDRTIRWVRDSVTVSQGTDGRRFVNGVVSDITSRKQTEDALRKSELELRRVLGAASDYFWSGDIDREGRFHYRYYSPAVEWITGRPADFYMAGSERWMSTIHPEDRARLAEISERLRSGQLVSSENEHRIVLPDGTIRWVRAKVTVSQSADGHRRLDGVVSDITAHKQSGEALRESEANLARAQSLAHLGNWSWDIQKDQLSWSDEMYRIYGVNRETFGHNLSAFVPLIHPQDMPRQMEAIKAAEAGRAFEPFEVRVVHPDGSLHVVEVLEAEVERDASGRPKRIFGASLDITERKRAEMALRESEERFRALIEHSFDVVALVNADGVIQFTSNSITRVMGYQPQELIGDISLELVHPEDLSRATELLNQLIRSPGRTMTGQFRCRHKDGSWRWLEMSCTNCLALPAVGGIITNYRDITERKQSGEKLRESEERYRGLAESAADAIFIIDRDDRVQYLNTCAANMLRSTPQELTGMRRADLFPPETSEHQRREIEEVFESGKIRHVQNRTRFTGGDIWLDTQLVPLRSTDGEIRAVMGVSRDITEQKRTEATLRESEERYRLMAEAIPQLAWRTNSQGEVMDCNSQWCEYTGQTPEEARGFGWKKALHPDDVDRVIQSVQEDVAGGGLFQVEYRLRRGSDGSYRWHLARTLPVKDEDGQIVSWFGSAVDVEDQRRAQERLEERVRERTSELAFTNEALRQSEAKYRTLAEEIPAITYIAELDEASTTLYISPQVKALLGFTPGDYKADPNTWRQHVHPDDLKRVMAELKRTHANHEPFDCEYRIVHRTSREIVWVRDKAVVVRDEAGQPLFLQGVMLDVTERHQAEETMQLQSAALESAANGIVITDREGLIVWVNPAFTKLTGYELSEVIGKDLRVLRSYQHDKAFYENLWQTPRSGRVWHGEIVNKRKDGSFYTEEETIAPMRDAAGEIAHFIFIKQDITERKWAEENLRLQSVALEAAANGIVITDREGHVAWVNPAFTKLTGYELSEVIGKDLRVLRSGQHDKAFYKNLWQTMLSGRVWHGEIVNKRKDGSLYTEEMTITPVHDAAGEIAHFIGIKQDITDRKSAEESRRHLAAIVESSNDAIISANLDGIITSWNAAAQRLFNYAPEEIVGRSLLVLIPPNRRSEAMQLLKKVRAGERIHIETVRLKKRRIPVNVASTVSPIKNDAGQIIGTSAVIRDITERKELEQAVVEAGSREQRRIGHDLHDGLCQQLTGISLLWKAIAQSVDARALPEVAEVREITQLIAKTIGEARDLARGLCPVELERNDLGVALKKLGLSMERLFAVSCVVRRQQPVVLADKTAAAHLYRIAQEAISNAIHHGKAARVWVHLNWKKNRLTLRIRDNGSGFSKRRSFKEGIGIRSMKYRAQVIGGLLTIESKRGVGTTVACVYTQPKSKLAGVARRHKRL